MKNTVEIVLFAMLLAFSMQSTAMAEYKLKPAGEIGKNLFGMGVEKAKENPEMVEKAAKKITGENETETSNSVEPVNTTDRNNPFVKLLEAQYLKYYEAGNNGDIDAWINTRDAKTATKLRDYPGLTSDMLKKASKGNADLRKFEFVSVETAGNAARIIHKKATKDSLIVEGSMYFNEGGEWKMGDGSQLTYGGDMAKDIDGALKEILAKPKLQLPKS